MPWVVRGHEPSPGRPSWGAAAPGLGHGARGCPFRGIDVNVDTDIDIDVDIDIDLDVDEDRDVDVDEDGDVHIDIRVVCLDWP